MNILHLDPDDLESPLAGGQAVRTFEIDRRLVKKGHRVTVITANYRGAKDNVKEGIRYIHVGLKRYPFNLLSFWFIIPFILNRHSFDLLIEENVSPFTFCFTPLFTKKPVISQTQTFGADISSRRYHLPFTLVERYGTRLYRNFIVLTESMKRRLHAINPAANIKVIPNGIEKTHPPTKKAGDYLLFLGRIDYREKGLDLLIEVMEILKKTSPKIRLVIAGKGNDEDTLKNILKEKQNGNIEYMGKITGKDKERVIRGCFALVHPSRHDNFPFTFLEAASYGKPIVCFAIDNLKELMKEDIGIAVDPFDTQRFAADIQRLKADASLYAILSKNASAWAKKHLWDKIADKQEEFYLKCMNG